MLDYDYLARPVKLVPRALEAMPVVEDGGRTYLCRVRKGIYFTPDPAFKGRPRELTAADFAYGFKRILDPAVKSPWLWLLEGKLRGRRGSARAAPRRAAASTTTRRCRASRWSIATRCASASRRRTCAFRTCSPCRTWRRRRARWSRRTARDIGAHPVGTGPYMLGEYRRSARIVLVANPGYRDDDLRAGRTDSGGVAAGGRGAEGQASCRWPARRDQHHRGGPGALAGVPRSRARFPRDPARRFHRAGARRERQAAAGARRQGHRARRAAAARTSWWNYFNMEDPVVGGYTPEKIALRRAIGMGYDNDERDPRAAQGTRGAGATVRSRRTSPATIRRCKTDAQIYDPGRGARAARQVRLQGPRRRRLSRDARRQAADGRALVDAERRRSGRPTSCGRRTWTRSASGWCSRRTACRSCARWRAWARSRCARRLERRLPGCRELHAAPVRTLRPREQRALQSARVQPALRARAHAAGWCRSEPGCSTA